jgi:starvation-inducible DNA-binding protein
LTDAALAAVGEVAGGLPLRQETSMTALTSENQLSALKPDARAEIGQHLEAALLELVDLGLVGKQLHWSVVGPGFRSLHEDLDQMVEAWHGLADGVAERALAVGFWPDARAGAIVAAVEPVDLKPGPVRDGVVIATLVQRLAEVAERIRIRMDRLGDLDAVSQDALTEVLRTLEEQVWMLRVQLPETAE